MKTSLFKQLIKEACREVIKEELQDIKIMLMEHNSVKKPLKEHNLNFTTQDVDRVALMKKFLPDDIKLPQAKNPIAQKFIQNTAKDNNPFLSILAETANEIVPGELNNFTNIGG